jgi:predicted O-linked N-acetylglucosamine transferase (SPINDLY family)
MPGAFMRGRHCLAFLPQSGAEALIARDEAEYVAFATDVNRQREVVRGLHPESLFMDLRPVRAIDELLLSTVGS